MFIKKKRKLTYIYEKFSCLPYCWYHYSCLPPIFMFTIIKDTFSKIFSSLRDKRLLYPCFYI